MNTPALLVGAALLFWGWQAHLLPIAAILAVVFEGSRLSQARREFSQADLDRVWNLCTLAFLGAAIYSFTASEEARGLAGSVLQKNPRVRADLLAGAVQPVFLFFQRLPLYFIPILLVQAWGQRQTLPASTFSWWLRRKRGQRGARSPEWGFNVSYPYFGFCLLGASAARTTTPWFLAALVLLLGWSLWPSRSRDFSPISWAASLLLAGALGLTAQRGVLYLQMVFQKLDNALVSRFTRGQAFEANESRTLLGAIGKLKLSGKIVLFVDPGNKPPPALLREASFNLFRSPVWGSSKRDFNLMAPENDETTWLLAPAQPSNHVATITELLPGGKGLLVLPQGTTSLEKLPVFLLETNRLGAVRSAAGPGFLEFSAQYGDSAALDAPPDHNGSRGGSLRAGSGRTWPRTENAPGMPGTPDGVLPG